MKIIDFIEKKLAAYAQWRHTPLRIDPMSMKVAVCMNCGDTYVGSFCPRCGQPAKTRRLSLKNATRTLLDTWGLGQHSLLRTIWHLMARPGYMIGDYLDGHRQPYLQPFKAVLVIGTLYAFIYALGSFSGHIAHKSKDNIAEKTEMNIKIDKASANSNVPKTEAKAFEEQFDKELDKITKYVDAIGKWLDKNKIWQQLLLHLLLAIIAVWLCRKAPSRPGLYFSEHFVAQVYICTQMGFVTSVIMLCQLLLGQDIDGSMAGFLSLAILIVDYKQLYGYGYLKAAWKTILSIVLSFLILISVSLLVVIILGIHSAYVAT